MEQLFDHSKEYDAMRYKGLSISGEDKIFFIQGRIKNLKARLPNSKKNARILDFGCGIGDATVKLAEYFPDALEIVGTDLSDSALEYATKRRGSDRISFVSLSNIQFQDPFGLCYVNGVFHQIELPSRRPTI